MQTNQKRKNYPSAVTRFIFFCLGRRLTKASLESASPFVIGRLLATSLTGRLGRVYLVPLPSLCCFNLRSMSVVVPQ